MSTEKAKAKQIQVEANAATPAGSLQELIETRKILPRATTSLDGAMSKGDKAKLQDLPSNTELDTALEGKVDKVTGKGLSTNDYSNADKAKLSSLESSHFRGVYVNEAALATIPDPIAGDYADVDAGVGSDAERWIYDASDSKWIVQESATSVTASQVKQLYESNTDTNAFSDTEKTKLSELPTNQTLTSQLSTKADKTIQVIAGIGLSGGGSLAANRTLDVDYGTAAGTAAQGNDSRLSNSREWTAATVSQAEAEAGTASTRRAWTSQRVRQAIVAWWNTVGTTFGKTLLGSTDAAAARGNLRLGTAAIKDVGTATGNVMEVGAFGLGNNSNSTVDVTNETRNGIYTFNKYSTGLPPQVDPNGAVGLIFNWGNSHQWGLFGEVQNNRVFLRRYVTTQNDNDVVELHTTGNILTTTGQSTQYPMTQKAVTDALGTKADRSTQVIAGTGLNGGGNLTANRTLSVKYGTAAGTAVQGNAIVQTTGTDNTKVMSQKSVTDVLEGKVDKVTGKGLSTNDFTTPLLNKLTGLESSHFRGVYINEAALSAIPDPVAGDYADVDAGAGADAERWIYDVSDAKWVAQESTTSLTAAQVKQLYESNADTNSFTDDDKSKLTALKTTVSQAEAELGTSTVVRSWTAQRVRQAINAWWNTASTGFGKTLLSSNTPSDARTSLQLGTAATANISQSTGVSTSGLMSQNAVTEELYKRVAKSTKVTAGTGLNGGGDLSDNLTLSVKYGTTEGTALQGNAIVQTVGTDTTKVMSQNAVKDELDRKVSTAGLSTAISAIGNMNVTGSITATGNVTAYSDISIKKNLTVIDNPISKVKSLTGYTYDRKDIETPRQTGLIAQDVQKVLPEAVVENEDGVLSLAYGNMVGLLVEAIKEQQTQIDNLKKEIELIRRG